MNLVDDNYYWIRDKRHGKLYVGRWCSFPSGHSLGWFDMPGSDEGLALDEVIILDEIKIPKHIEDKND